jgi:hypothetical protein
MVSHPYSIYIWQPPLSAHVEKRWHQPIQCATQQWALYIANLIHRDSHAVIKVELNGLNIQCFPDAHAVELVERQIARHEIEEPDITMSEELPTD